MYVAKIINKEEIDNIFSVTVEFSNGVKTVIEKVKPQDEAGFNHWVKSRIASLDSAEVFQAADNLDKPIDVSDPGDTRTQAEKDAAKWQTQFAKLKQAQELVDLGVTTVIPKRDNLLTKVSDGYLPEYLD
jgi:hypothetical protein